MEPVDVFRAVATCAPPQQIPLRGKHPVPKLCIVCDKPPIAKPETYTCIKAPQANPVSTNKFYANLFLGGQGQGVWTHPYSLTWSKGTGNASSWGMAVSHIEASQRGHGPPNTAIAGHPVQFFINPIGIQSMILSAVELGTSTVLISDTLQAFSANANLFLNSNSPRRIKFPLVQGMGFVTGLYSHLQPSIESGVGFRRVIAARSTRSGMFKYCITLEDSSSWLLYARSDDEEDPKLVLSSNARLQGLYDWSGMIQVAKNPSGGFGEAVYDSSAGAYATGVTITGSTCGHAGIYQLHWTKAGFLYKGLLPRLVMFALPHHIQSFHDKHTTSSITSIQLMTTTKGIATAVIADKWELFEPDLPTGIGFAPHRTPDTSRSSLSTEAQHLIEKVAILELKQNILDQSNLDSMYYSGKALSKFATLVYATHDLLRLSNLAREGLSQLKIAFARFATNRQLYPLVYDTTWAGIVSSCTYVTGNPGLDFGNTFYNDHHFHYGYFIHTAAILAYLDPHWLPQNKDWVNTLVRDASNPSTEDNYYPFSRAFDWYHGHSFAKGLFESADSKDEESTSEDAFFSYALKMWGHVVGDASMEARGNLMLAIQRRTFDQYFLMQSNNTCQPRNFIDNKIAGILFENKIDHTTYFGNNPEYIHGIHMIPHNPSTSYTRSPKFVQEEWLTYFSASSPYSAAQIEGGWRGILYANLVVIDPKASWEFFAQDRFDPSWLDGGQTRTWALICAAFLGGAS